MVVEQIVAKNKSPYSFSNSVLINDFDGKNSKITKNNCCDRYIYLLDYAKDVDRNVFYPLHIIIPEAKGYTCLNYKGCQCLNLLSVEYEDIWTEIVMKLRAINNDREIEFADVDYHDIALDGLCIDLPLDKMIKFNAMIISIRLIMEVDD